MALFTISSLLLFFLACRFVFLFIKDPFHVLTSSALLIQRGEYPNVSYYYGKSFNFISKLSHLLLPRHILWRAAWPCHSRPNYHGERCQKNPIVHASYATRIFERTFNSGDINDKMIRFSIVEMAFSVSSSIRERMLCVRVCSHCSLCTHTANEQFTGHVPSINKWRQQHFPMHRSVNFSCFWYAWHIGKCAGHR